MLLAVVAALLILGAGVSRAEDCPAGCAEKRRTCLRAAEIGRSACTRECRETGGTAPCLRGCVASARTAKEGCRSNHVGCMAGCQPSLPRSCAAECASRFSACSGEARACRKRCRTAADRSACAAECAEVARPGGPGCEAQLGTCLKRCGEPTTTTVQSPTTTVEQPTTTIIQTPTTTIRPATP
jgi:hypothetical protein